MRSRLFCSLFASDRASRSSACTCPSSARTWARRSRRPTWRGPGVPGARPRAPRPRPAPAPRRSRTSPARRAPAPAPGSRRRAAPRAISWASGSSARASARTCGMEAEAFGDVEGVASARHAHDSSKRGASVSGSSAIEAFTTAVSSCASTLRLPRCVVATAHAPVRAKCLSSARPSDAPSDGSVPEPSSSSRNRHAGPAARAMAHARRDEVRGERRKVRLDRLRIADVGQDQSPQRQSCAFVGGDIEPRLGHQREQADRLNAPPSCRPCSAR